MFDHQPEKHGQKKFTAKWPSGQIIIFHQPRFPWNKGFPLLNHHLGAQVVWGRYNLTRPITWFSHGGKGGAQPFQSWSLSPNSMFCHKEVSARRRFPSDLLISCDDDDDDDDDDDHDDDDDDDDHDDDDDDHDDDDDDHDDDHDDDDDDDVDDDDVYISCTSISIFIFFWFFLHHFLPPPPLSSNQPTPFFCLFVFSLEAWLGGRSQSAAPQQGMDGKSEVKQKYIDSPKWWWISWWFTMVESVKHSDLPWKNDDYHSKTLKKLAFATLRDLEKIKHIDSPNGGHSLMVMNPIVTIRINVITKKNTTKIQGSMDLFPNVPSFNIFRKHNKSIVVKTF